MLTPSHEICILLLATTGKKHAFFYNIQWTFPFNYIEWTFPFNLMSIIY